MADRQQQPSYAICVEKSLSEAKSPLSIDQLVDAVSSQRSVGKGARSAVYRALSQLYQAVSVGPATFGWLPNLLKDQRFRHPLNKAEVRRGFLLLDELEHAVFFPDFFQNHETEVRSIEVGLMGGPVIQAQAAVEQGTWSLRLGAAFTRWVEVVGGNAYDDLLIWVEDAVEGRYGIRLQPKESRQESIIQERNQILAQSAEEIVAGDRKLRPSMPVWELAAALIGRSLFEDPVPPDDMHFVLHEQSRLVLQEDMGYALGSSLSTRHTEKASRNPRSQSSAPSFDLDGLESLLEQELADVFFESGIERTESDQDGLEDGWEFWDEQDSETDDLASEHCESYQSYLSELEESAPEERPLSHVEFHLLEAELEMLVGLENEFGYLMPEQESRKLALADRLFIDPNIFGSDWDQQDFDDPPFWEN